jgi:hypothetical protein
MNFQQHKEPRVRCVGGRSFLQMTIPILQRSKKVTDRNLVVLQDVAAPDPPANSPLWVLTDVDQQVGGHILLG